MTPRFADSADDAIPLHLIDPAGLPAARAALDPAQRRWLDASGFAAGVAEAVALPAADGAVALALLGLGDPAARRGGRFLAAGAADRLPPGTFRIAAGPSGEALADIALGWLLHGYRYDAFRKQDAPKRLLVRPEGVDVARIEAVAAGVFLARDLVNAPACAMGPEALEQAARALAADHGAEIAVTVGEALLQANLPLIHAVGRAAAQAPRLIDLRWGRADAPTVTLVGKGVCFDTGGLDIKPSASMRLMKKDMGGAAAALGLARMIMARGLDIRLRVLVPAVENAVGPLAFRPGDILRSRKGLSVEIGNTDAEGRLVLADAMALAAEERPGLMIDFATLTGAARVALGPDLPALFTDDEALAAELLAAGARAADPLWRLPLWDGYEEDIKSPVADLDNAPAGGMAGAITAALFLRRFAEGAGAWAHVDLYAWNAKARPGRPAGGELQAGRAVFALLEARHGRV